MLLLEQVLVGLARLDHRGHVDVVEGGQHRRGVLRFLEAPGDRLAQAGHLDPLFLASPLAGCRAAGCGAGRAARGGAGASARRRLLGLAPPRCTSSLVIRPSLPVPLIRVGSTPMLEHRAADRGRQRRHAGRRCPHWRVACGACRLPRSCGRFAGAGGVGRRGFGALVRRALRPLLAPSSIRAITAPTATVSPTLTMLAEYAGDRRGHFDR